MYIGEVAKLTGVTPRAIRLYEDMALIEPPKRHGKYRLFNKTHLEHIYIIKSAQNLGFKLKELKGMFAEDISCSHFPIEKVADIIQLKIQETEQEVQKAQERITQLKELLALAKSGACDDFKIVP